MTQKLRTGAVVVVVAALLVGGAVLLREQPASSSSSKPLLSSRPAPRSSKAKRSAPPSGRVLFGEVVAGDGSSDTRPVVGARVEALVGDSNDVFTLDDLPASLRAVRFSAPGFSPVTVDVAALPDSPEAFWSQTLQPGGEGVRVVVVDAAGQPLADTQSVVVSRRGPPGRPRFRASNLVRTDVAGVAALTPAADLAYVVVDGRRGAHELTDAERASKEARVTLPAPAVLRGRVVDDRGRAVVDATFALTLPTAAQTAAEFALAQQWELAGHSAADAAGAFVVDVAAGNVVVAASGKGVRPGRSAELRLKSGAQTAVDIVLQGSPRVGGVVVDVDSGAGIAACTITPDGREQGARAATSNDDGAFVLDSLIDRPSSLHVACAGYQALTLGGLDGGRSRHAPLRITMSKGEGKLVAGIGISLRRGVRGVRVSDVQPETPAARAGLVAEDVIEAVDDVEVGSRGAGLETAMALIRGQPGARVRLRVRGSDAKVRDVEIERALIVIPTN